MDYNRLPEENIKEYKIRLCLNKEQYNLTYVDIANLINQETGDTKGESAYRKWWAAYSEGYNDAERATASANDLLAAYDEKRIAAEKARIRFFDQRTEYNKQIRTDARFEELCDILSDSALKMANELVPLCNNTKKYMNINEHNEAVIVFNDWHYGMVTDNIYNAYNSDICKERVAKVVTQACDRLTLHNCSKLYVVILGDLCHGAIHTSARVASKELVADQIMQVSEIIAQAIEKLNEYVPCTEVYMTYGNHARTVANKEDSIHRDNMERLVLWWMRERLKGNDTIAVPEESSNEFIVISPCGHNMCAAHGDLDNVKRSPRLLSALFAKQYHINLEYILLGDKHHRESFDELGVTAMVCSSLCGTDDYANNHRLFSNPSQLMLIVNDEVGVDAEYQLKCWA